MWLDIPFVKQEQNGCGAASIAMVMRYWSRPADPDAIQRNLYRPSEKGIRASDMARHFEHEGFRAIAFSGEWIDLESHLAKGRPLIAALKQDASAPLHYVVIAGVESEYALINDPADRKLRKIARVEFEKAWSASSRWTLLAVPRSTN